MHYTVLKRDNTYSIVNIIGLGLMWLPLTIKRHSYVRCCLGNSLYVAVGFKKYV